VLRQARRKLRNRPWAIRKPKTLANRATRDLVEVDTKEIHMRGGVILKHFSARDVVSRWMVEVHRRATFLAAARFLDSLLDRTPFPSKHWQVEAAVSSPRNSRRLACKKELPLFVAPPKSPKLNAHVERSNRTHNEEFYEVRPNPIKPRAEPPVAPLGENLQLRAPASVVGYLTPLEFITQWKRNLRKAKVSLSTDEYGVAEKDWVGYLNCNEVDAIPLRSAPDTGKTR